MENIKNTENITELADKIPDKIDIKSMPEVHITRKELAGLFKEMRVACNNSVIDELIIFKKAQSAEKNDKATDIGIESARVLYINELSFGELYVNVDYADGIDGSIKLSDIVEIQVTRTDGFCGSIGSTVDFLYRIDD